jgi:hypothetical protein
VADLKDKHPLPPQSRKKYLAHSLYGLGADHKGILVQQLNHELRAQHKMKRNHFLPGDDHKEVREITVSNGVGWGDGGKIVTNIVVGKFKYESLVLTSACVRMQRIWRLKVYTLSLFCFSI